MTPEISYPAERLSGQSFEPARVWAIAASLRRQIELATGRSLGAAEDLAAALPGISVNGHVIAIAWDFRHPVHDDDGRPVLGVCETDPDDPSSAYVSVNGPLLGARPDLMLSTAAHELGHAVFDVPAMLEDTEAARRRLRALTPSLASTASFCAALARTVCLWRARPIWAGPLGPSSAATAIPTASPA